MKPIYDVNTSNQSFIEMWKLLKDKGVKNNKFFLILYDPGLSGVDPYDPNLSDEMKLRILAEVQKNFWYYLREVVHIIEPGGFAKYGLHIANLAQNFCMLNNINVVELLPRQHGKTIGAICFYTWVYNFNTSNSQIIFGNKSVQDSELNLKRFKETVEALPSYLKAHMDSKTDTDNIQYIRCKRNQNTISLLKSANDPVSADKAGRGLTTPLIWIQ